MTQSFISISLLIYIYIYIYIFGKSLVRVQKNMFFSIVA